MAVRREPPPRDPAVATAVWSLPAATASVPWARRQAGRWLASVGASTRESQDVELVVSELVTNAVHASHTCERVQLELAATGEGWAITVRDCGEGFTPSSSTVELPDDLLSTGGRGLPVVSALAGPLAVERDDQGWNAVRTVLARRERPAIRSVGSGRSAR